MNGKLEGLLKENGLVEELAAPGVGTIMVIGGPDTGKTTLVEVLSGMLSERFSTGVVDLDMGQSHIGPPTTLAWGKVAGGFRGWHDIIVEDFYFTGAISPAGNLLPAVVGAARIAGRAGAGCEKVVIDTTGLIAGPPGRILKEYKIEALSPDVILALERSDELTPILGHLKSRKRPAVKRLSVPGEVASKSASLRSDYRGLRLEEYFSSSPVVEVSSKETGIRYTRGLDDNGDPTGRVVSFRDDDQKDLALGIIERAEPKEGLYIIRTPLGAGAAFSTLVIGTATVPM